MHIGIALRIKLSVLQSIEQNYHKVEERAFRMLNEWMQRSANPCYCRLIAAMNEEHLIEGVVVLQEKINSSEYFVSFVAT